MVWIAVGVGVGAALVAAVVDWRIRRRRRSEAVFVLGMGWHSLKCAIAVNAYGVGSSAGIVWPR